MMRCVAMPYAMMPSSTVADKGRNWSMFALPVKTGISTKVMPVAQPAAQPRQNELQFNALNAACLLKVPGKRGDEDERRRDEVAAVEQEAGAVDRLRNGVGAGDDDMLQEKLRQADDGQQADRTAANSGTRGKSPATWLSGG